MIVEDFNINENDYFRSRYFDIIIRGISSIIQKINLWFQGNSCYQKRSPKTNHLRWWRSNIDNPSTQKMASIMTVGQSITHIIAKTTMFFHESASRLYNIRLQKRQYHYQEMLVSEVLYPNEEIIKRYSSSFYTYAENQSEDTLTVPEEPFPLRGSW